MATYRQVWCANIYTVALLASCVVYDPASNWFHNFVTRRVDSGKWWMLFILPGSVDNHCWRSCVGQQHTTGHLAGSLSSQQRAPPSRFFSYRHAVKEFTCLTKRLKQKNNNNTKEPYFIKLHLVQSLIWEVMWMPERNWEESCIQSVHFWALVSHR